MYRQGEENEMLRTTLIQCKNPHCEAHYPSRWHQEGKAAMYGSLNFCNKECKEEYQYLLKTNERIQP